MPRLYPPTRPETVRAIVNYYAMVANGQPMPPEALNELLRICIPHGSIVEAWVRAPRAEGNTTTATAGIRIKGIASKLNASGRRDLDPPTIPKVIAFTLFGGHPYIKKDGRRPTPSAPPLRPRDGLRSTSVARAHLPERHNI